MNTSLSGLNKIPELRKRILYTVFMLAVYRIGIFVSTPGVNRVVMKSIIDQASSTIFGFFNMFVGGALERLSVFALGIMPYISSSIILQLLTVVSPQLERLQKEGEQGRKKITQYTRYGTVLLSIIQGYAISFYLESLTSPSGELVVAHPGWSFRLLTVISLTAGTAFLMWIGEQITEKGLGNGISLIIFAGIISSVPAQIFQTVERIQEGILSPLPVILLVAFMAVIIGLVVFFERAQRRIPVQYAKRVVGKRMYGGTSHLPLKFNSAGVIPPIFASSLLMFPATIAQYIDADWIIPIQNALNPGEWIYNLFYVVLIVFFCFFYTAVTFNPVDVADNMKKNGGYIPGIRPGKKTAEFIDFVLTRITFGGALYISFVCLLPTLVQLFDTQIPFYFGGTALLIVVGVALDTVQQIESHLISRNYEGFAGPKGPRIRGRQR